MDASDRRGEAVPSDDDASDRFAARVEAEVSRVLRHRRAIRDDALESRVREAESKLEEARLAAEEATRAAQRCLLYTSPSPRDS